MKTLRIPRKGGFLRGIARAVAALALAFPFLAATAQDRPSAQSMRAAMVFNFLKFTEFPPDGADPQRLKLCFSVADASQADALMALSGRKVWSRDLVVGRLGERGDNCQVLYVDSYQRWNAAVDSHSTDKTLTIGGYPGFVEDGGMIQLDVENDGNRFEINLAQARSARFRMSPQLLRLARRIYE